MEHFGFCESALVQSSSFRQMRRTRGSFAPVRVVETSHSPECRGNFCCAWQNALAASTTGANTTQFANFIFANPFRLRDPPAVIALPTVKTATCEPKTL